MPDPPLPALHRRSERETERKREVREKERSVGERERERGGGSCGRVDNAGARLAGSARFGIGAGFFKKTDTSNILKVSFVLKKGHL